MQLTSRVPDDTNELSFYARCLELLRDKEVPFLLGGAVALKHHCGILRDTKDIDLFVRPRDLDRVLSVMDEAGYRTGRPFPHWLAKVYFGNIFIDVIFNSGNGATPVDDEWFTHATRGRILGVEVAMSPAEETIWSKAFVMERERYDGADVAHLIAACGPRLDWKRVIRRFGDNYRVLLSHVVLFGFVYPQKRDAIPDWVTRELVDRLGKDGNMDDVCRGTLLSREQYLVDVARGMRDGRLPPTGTMTAEEIALWTDAIPGHR